MPIHRYETEFSSADTEIRVDPCSEALLAWAAEDPLPVEHLTRTYKLPIVAVVAAAAAVVGALSMVAIHTTTAVAPPTNAPLAPSSAPPMPSPQPAPVEPSTEPPPPSPAPPVRPDPATRDNTFLNDLSQDGMHFPSGTAAAITEGHTVCDRLAGGELRSMVELDVIAGSVVPGYLPLTIDQARHLVDSAITVYCSVPAASMPVGPGHYTIA